jgi:hypothetical protein
MKTIVLATVLALTAAAPALAKSSSAQHVHAGHHVLVPHAPFAAPDPYGAHINSREIGRDPGVTIRPPVQNDYSDQEMGG